jgi:hypothetical protein
MLDNSEEMITLEKDKSLIIGVEILVLKIPSFVLKEVIKFSDYGLCPIIENKINLLFKNLFGTVVGMLNLDIPIDYEILKNESLDDITKININGNASLREIKFFYDININENLKTTIINKFNDLNNNKHHFIVQTIMNNLVKSLIKSMETNIKYLSEYDWCFIEKEKKYLVIRKFLIIL